jgi:enoyl-CoA hydratase/carnithine racemase
MTEDVLVSVEDAIVEIRLDRPAKKNALTQAMYGAMADALERAEQDGAIRAILIGGQGDVFCAGNDLADFAAYAGMSGGDGLHHGIRFLRALVATDKPVIAAVAGDGVGIGLTMLLHCDVVVVAEDARLMAPFTSLGLTPEGASSLLLPERIGHQRAYAVLALGQTLSGKEAAQVGLATLAVPRAQVDPEARRLAAECCARPPEAMSISKRLMRDRDAILRRIDEESRHFRERLTSAEARAAFEAFFKR